MDIAEPLEHPLKSAVEYKIISTAGSESMLHLCPVLHALWICSTDTVTNRPQLML